MLSDMENKNEFGSFDRDFLTFLGGYHWRRSQKNSARKKTAESAERSGGPAWTRTRNQTVMSADDNSSDVENADEFGSFDRDF